MLKHLIIHFIILSLISVVGIAVARSDEPAHDRQAHQKITFDLQKLNEQGLYGHSGGWRSVDYEFCIPAEKRCIVEVKNIDATVVVYKSSSGRIGCSEVEYLCIGNTRQENFKAVLVRLAGLEYIDRIDRCVWE